MKLIDFLEIYTGRICIIQEFFDCYGLIVADYLIDCNELDKSVFLERFYDYEINDIVQNLTSDALNVYIEDI